MEFNKFGAVKDVHIPVDFRTRAPRGFAYIEFETMEDARNGLGMDGMVINGRKVNVAFAEGDRKTPGAMKGKKEADALRAQLEKVKMMQQNHLQRFFPEAVQPPAPAPVSVTMDPNTVMDKNVLGDKEQLPIERINRRGSGKREKVELTEKVEKKWKEREKNLKAKLKKATKKLEKLRKLKSIKKVQKLQKEHEKLKKKYKKKKRKERKRESSSEEESEEEDEDEELSVEEESGSESEEEESASENEEEEEEEEDSSENEESEDDEDNHQRSISFKKTSNTEIIELD
ncbi:Oidioi.mRNA.OKI2018_I69.chr1.g1024.t1.cds [Oikopleura dioica]|uniref:Oidioi.mRNA.OKI2018_I69.chr1.g1024.t1.cds n=1 Tax=Oikopleura dioica TaxID=34765 RepID=A0ABN7SQW4_OIKDI|nr:Oidioi.mRNA.OKI2018_I69.chr1.g1024.t1.cds [Oikopleura dioica]